MALFERGRLPWRGSAERAVTKMTCTLSTDRASEGRPSWGPWRIGGGAALKERTPTPFAPSSVSETRPDAMPRLRGQASGAIQAVTGWRACRVHGAGGGHPSGKAHPSWKHGMRAREWIDLRRSVNELVREARKFDGMGKPLSSIGLVARLEKTLKLICVNVRMRPAR